MMLYDFHSHVLPGVDDGCQTTEEALAVLERSRKAGVVGMVATPHYYSNMPIDEFLRAREAAAKTLAQAAVGHEIPELCYGAEVAFHSGISRMEGLDRLCMGKSRYMLIEMPFEPWSEDVLRELRSLENLAIMPLIAHVERYFPIQNRRTLRDLCMQDFLIQMNSGSLAGIGAWRTKHWVREGRIQLLGTDCHNNTTRHPDMDVAVRALRKPRLREAFDYIGDVSRQVFEDMTVPETSEGRS